MNTAKAQVTCDGVDYTDIQALGGNCQLADAQLAERTARLQAILDTTVDGIVTIDEQRVVQSFNKAAERIFGYRAEEVIGKNVNILQPSPYREHHDEYVENYLRTGIRKIIGIGREVEGRRKDGSTFPLYLAVSEVQVGNKRYFAGILRDLTEQKEAVEEIRSLARFPEENPHPTLRVSREGVLLYANAAAECLLETWGSRVGELLPESWRRSVVETFKSNEPKEFEAACGSSTYSLTMVPIKNARDINIYGGDITERKIAEKALRDSEEKHRTLVQSSTDAILVMDRERRILSFNQSFLDLFGFRREEVEGQSTRIIHPSHSSFVEFGEKALPAIEAAGSFRTEWELVRRDGTIVPVEETLSEIRMDNGAILGLLAIIRDTTQRKEAEKRLEDYRAHLEEMVIERTGQLEEAYKAMLHEEKLKTLGTISAEMAHEIRNPLMAIGGFARRLQKKMPELSEVGVIVQESGRLEEILRRIETYLKPVELRPTECSVNEITREAIELISAELDREGIKLNLHLSRELPPAYVDPAVLIQVIINVIHNAAKVMRRDGRITIQTFGSDQKVYIYIRAPLKGHIKDPEHVFVPFGEDREEISVPVCFQLLRGMGGQLSLVQENDTVIFAASLLRAVTASDP